MTFLNRITLLLFLTASIFNLSAQSMKVSIDELNELKAVRLKQFNIDKKYFAGKVQSATSVDLSFQNAGKVVYVAPVGTSANSLICDSKDNTIIPGGLIAMENIDLLEAKYNSSLAQLKSSKAHLDEAKLKYERCKLLFKKKVVSEMECQGSLRDYINEQENVKSNEADLFSAKYLLDACSLRAPFAGEVTEHYVSDGSWVNKGEKILRFEMLSIMSVTIDMPRVLVNKIDYDDKLLVYPMGLKKAVGGWLYEIPVKKASIKMMIKNRKVSTSTIPEKYGKIT